MTFYTLGFGLWGMEGVECYFCKNGPTTIMELITITKLEIVLLSIGLLLGNRN